LTIGPGLLGKGSEVPRVVNKGVGTGALAHEGRDAGRELQRDRILKE